jgi:DNA-binding transcriptional regulator YdaS (Cro superfamily)
MQGPLQKFAHDLQVLRRQAGEPTYRTMARLAGLSPTVLSQATKGRRLPTLQTTLAFIRACGGDAATEKEWQSRWEEIREAHHRASAQEPPPDAPPAPPAPPSAPPSGTRRLLLPAVSAAVLAAVAAFAVLFWPSGPSVRPIADGDDPYVRHCGPDQQVMERQPIYRADGTAYGWVVLFYSAACEGAWGYVLGPNSPQWTVHIAAHRMDDDAVAPSAFRGEARPNSWGNALSTRTGCVRAEAWIDNGPRAATSCWRSNGPVIHSN